MPQKNDKISMPGAKKSKCCYGLQSRQYERYDHGMITIEKFDIFLTQNNAHVLRNQFPRFFSQTKILFSLFQNLVRRTTVKLYKTQMAQMGNRHENIPTNTCQKKNNLLLTLGVRKKIFSFFEHIFKLLYQIWLVRRTSDGRPTDEHQVKMNKSTNM